MSLDSGKYTTETTHLDYALAYQRLGWHILPLRPGTKLPACAWRNGTDVGDNPYEWRASNDEARIRRWWTDTPNAGVGVDLRASGLCALDYDVRSDPTLRPGSDYGAYGRFYDSVGGFNAPTSMTATGGVHALFLSEGSDGLSDTRYIELKRNLLVLPPTLPADATQRYAWIHDPCNAPLTPVPDDVRAAFLALPKRQYSAVGGARMSTGDGSAAPTLADFLADPPAEGGREHAVMRLLGRVWRGDNRDEVADAAVQACQACGLSLADAARLAQSTVKYHREDRTPPAECLEWIANNASS